MPTKDATIQTTDPNEPEMTEAERKAEALAKARRDRMTPEARARRQAKVDKAIANLEARGERTRRYLSEGEEIHAPQFAFPGVMLSGTAAGVVEFEDGGPNGFIYPAPTKLTDAVFVILVFDREQPIDGKRLAFLRKRAGMTQTDLATALDVTRQNIGEMERGLTPVRRTTADAVRFLLLRDAAARCANLDPELSVGDALAGLPSPLSYAPDAAVRVASDHP